MAEDAKGPMTIRQAVISYVCGTGRRRAVAKTKKKGQAVSEQQKAPVKKQGAESLRSYRVAAVGLLGNDDRPAR